MSPAVRQITTLLVVSNVFACALAKPAPPEVVAPLQPDELRMTVENRNFLDVTLYAFHEGYMQRIGQVTARTDNAFTFKWRSGFKLQVVVDYVGAGRSITDPIDVIPGEDDTLHLMIGDEDHIGARFNMGRTAR